jgi:hypothetical protein
MLFHLEHSGYMSYKYLPMFRVRIEITYAKCTGYLDADP